MDDYEIYFAEEDDKARQPAAYPTFSLALSRAQSLSRFRHHVEIQYLNADRQEVLNWCVSNFGPDGIPHSYSMDDITEYKIVFPASWTFQGDRYYFDNEDDALAFKMKFS